MTRVTKTNTVFTVLFFLSVTVFLALFIPFHPYPFSFVLKALPLCSLLVMVIIDTEKLLRFLLGASLFFSMCGDILLDIDRTRLFIPGLACFLVAHLLYVVIFLKGFRFSRPALFGSLAVLIYSAVIAILLSGIEGKFLPPVMSYLTVITAMTITAFFYRTSEHSSRGTWILLAVGALLFLFSDTIIAVNKFLIPIPVSLMFSLPCYFGGQFCIVTALRRSRMPAVSA